MSSSLVQIREEDKREANTNKNVKCLQGPQTICFFQIDFFVSCTFPPTIFITYQREKQKESGYFCIVYDMQ